MFYPKGVWPVLVMVCASLHAQEPASAIPATAGSTGESSKTSTNLIKSLLVDREMPRLGINWGANVIVDAPLNSEPDNAQITLRRAQLALWKGFGPDWWIRLTLLFDSDGKMEVDDNYVTYSGWETAFARLGVFTAPYSLENLSGLNSLTFMERALPVIALAEPKAAGIGILKRTPNSILSAALAFASPPQADVPQDGQALIMHYVHSPIDVLRSTSVHLGGSLSYRINADPNNTKFKAHPEVSVSDDYFVDTGVVTGADRMLRLGLEASSVMGPFSWQSEVLSTRVQRDGYDTAKFWGAYFYASWILTGESRNYNAGNGYFQPLRPSKSVRHGGWGAFEVAARASYVDLTNKDITGGEESNVSLGLNWYLNDQFRIMTNLIKVINVDRPGSEFDGEDPLIFALRVQWLLD